MSMKFNIIALGSLAVVFFALLVLGAPYLCRAQQAELEAYDALETANVKWNPQWTPDGRRIFFSNYGTVYAADLNGDHLALIDGNRLKDSEAAASPSISPDGSKIAYSHYSPIGPFIWSSSSNWRIVVANLDPPSKRGTTDDYLRAGNPVWLSDNKIAFTATLRLGGYYRRLPFVADVRPSGEIAGEAPLFNEGHWVNGPLVPSPDRRLIAFTSGDSNFDFPDLYVIGVDGSGLTKLAEATRRPAWHPDGSRIAYAVGERTGDPVHLPEVATGIFTIRPDGTDRREIISFPEPGIRWRDGLTWHPDGSTLYFAGHIVAADGSEMREADWAGGYSTFSPDGMRIAHKNNGLIVTTWADGSNSRVLPGRTRGY